MKLKKIFVVAVLFLIVFLIYLATMDKKIYYLALGDSISLKYPKQIANYLEEKNLLEQYHNEFVIDDMRITDLIRDIKDNKKVVINKKDQTIKNSLIKADLVTLSIGNEELFYKMKTEKPDNLFNYIDDMMIDMENLFVVLKEYCKEDIFILGYVNPFSNDMDRYIEYANKKLETLAKKYDISYVSLKELKNEDFNGSELLAKGNEKIVEQLIPFIDKQVIDD
ncbi:MAG: hypothetical protein HFH09_01560 [Bacilli bacterium]|jgi:hypothetical protein|nr:hypothetical protein [Bacilli bacterium]